MFLKLLCSDSECSDVSLETAVTLKFYQPFSTENFGLQRNNPKVVKWMFLKLLYYDSRCTDIPLD